MTLGAGAVSGLGYACFVIACLLYLFHVLQDDEYLGRLATWTQLGGVLLWGTAYVWSMMSSDEPSVTSLYGVLLLVAWACAVVSLVMEWAYGLKAHAPLVLIIVLATGAVALFGVSPGAAPAAVFDFRTFNPWLLGFYLLTVTGYATLLVAGTLGVLELLRPLCSKRVLAYDAFSEYVIALIVRQNVRWALVALAVAMLGGACWSWLSSGHYWVWTPVAIWMWVTWLIYGAYVHLGRFRGWPVAIALGMVLVASAVGSLVT